MRNKNIDFFRVIAIFSVVIIHCAPFKGIFPIEYFLNSITRFAVPFFFIVSSYFFSKKLNSNRNSIKVIYLGFFRRISTIFFFWSFIYLFSPKYSLLNEYGLIYGMYYSIMERITTIIVHPIYFLYTGTAPHLWFLPSLLLGISFLTLLSQLRLQNLLIPLGMALYIFGLTKTSYANLFEGSILASLNSGRLPFVLLFIAAGSIIAKYEQRIFLIKKQIYAIIASGYIVFFIETIILCKYFSHPLEKHEFNIGIAISAIGISLLAITDSQIGSDKKIADFGKFTLGVYCIHLLLISSPINWVIGNHFNQTAWQIIYPFFITLISFLAVIILSRVSVLRKFVT